jgi:hypothetical protein
MAILEIPKDPSPKTLALFGWLLGLVLCAFGGLVALRSGWLLAPKVLMGSGVVIAIAYYAIPPIRRPIYLAWVYAFWPVGTVVSLVLLGAVYYGVLTPIGLLRRLASRDSMQRRFDTAASSYWEAHPGKPAADRYFKPY